MADVKDFRPHAVNMAATANDIAIANVGEPVVDLDVDYSVHLHCDGKVFIVYRDIVVAGAMYFECALLGFFKETRDQKIVYDDIDVEALEFYLDIAHGWFFEIKVRGARAVPPRVFDGLINALLQGPWIEHRLEIPQVKLATLAQTVILGDRFVHRPLLSILRHMFVSLLEVHQDCWNKLKNKTRDWDEVWYSEFMLDFLDAFDLLSTGHDDEKLLRDSLTESFYWFSRPVTGLIDHFAPILPVEFFQELHLERDSQDKMRKRQHAWGISTTDQMMYAAKTRQQKDRRFKRVVNLCSPETHGEWLPWFHDAEEIRIRNLFLDGSATARFPRPSSIRSGARPFVPGAATHRSAVSEAFAPKAVSQTEGSDGYQRPARRRNGKPRGGKRSRGGLRVAETNFPSGGSAEPIDNLKVEAATKPQLSETPAVIYKQLLTGNARNMRNDSESPAGSYAASPDQQINQANMYADGMPGKKKNKRRNKNKKQQHQGDLPEQGNHSQQVGQAHLQPAPGIQFDGNPVLSLTHARGERSRRGRAEQNTRGGGNRGRGGSKPQHLNGNGQPTFSNEPAAALADENVSASGITKRVGTRERGRGWQRGKGRGGPINSDTTHIPRASNV